MYTITTMIIHIRTTMIIRTITRIPMSTVRCISAWVLLAAMLRG